MVFLLFLIISQILDIRSSKTIPTFNANYQS